MILGQVALAAAAVLMQQNAGASAPDVTELSQDQAQALISKCGSRRFETIAEVPANGKLRRTRVTLCSAPGDDDAAWVNKLEKAAGQIEAQASLPAASKAKLLSELRAEIARVKSMQSLGLVKPPAAASATMAAPLPLPARRPERSPLADFSPLPPLTRAPAVSAAQAKPTVKLPQLSVQCVLLGTNLAQRCGVIASDERLVVRATESFDGPVSLRFRRTDSDVTAEVELASQSLRAGQTARLAIPKPICKGRLRAEFDIEVISPKAGSASGRVGSFETRCGL